MNITQNWNGETIKNLIFLDRNNLMNIVEIGSYEGLTSNYFCDELLGANGKLICLDPLSTDYELSEGDNKIFQGQYERFIENTEINKDKITLVRKKSEEVLPQLRDNHYSLIFIDGHHAHREVLIDSQEAFRICSVGGYILWDDYFWNPPTYPVKTAVDEFLSSITNYKLLLKLNQVLIQKLPEGSATEDGQHRYQELCIEKLFNKDTVHGAYCNLDERTDRNEKMIAELARVDLEIPIVRQRSFPWKEIWDNADEATMEKIRYMHDIRKTPGAIGCWFSQMEVMKEALRQGKHALITEDDIVICNDFPKRLKIIFEFLNQRDWDAFFFGGTWHTEPTWHRSIEGKHKHPDLQMCNCNLNRDWEMTNDLSIVRTYGAFSTHAYLLNKNRIQHLLDLMERRMSICMGIDFFYILEQPNLNCFAFNPGCIKQYDNQSNIGAGISRFSGFKSLGRHWFQRSMDKDDE